LEQLKPDKGIADFLKLSLHTFLLCLWWKVIDFARFEVVTAMLMKILVFLDVALSLS
jgi:hypothetical protein